MTRRTRAKDLRRKVERPAAQRAYALAEQHAGNGTAFPNDNPSSTVGDLLAAIEP